MTDFDLVIRNARIVDGTGRDEISGDVAIKDGVIASVGRVTGQGTHLSPGCGATV